MLSWDVSLMLILFPLFSIYIRWLVQRLSIFCKFINVHLKKIKIVGDVEAFLVSQSITGTRMSQKKSRWEEKGCENSHSVAAGKIFSPPKKECCNKLIQ